jgi:hemoglobin
LATSLYERLGGEAAIMAAVDLFYAKVLADDLTRPFFADLRMDAPVKKQVAFMTWAFGGPDEYRGRDLREAHRTLVARGLGDRHFDAVAEHLRSTLVELGVDTPLIGEVLGIVESVRNRVLDR